MQDAEETAEKAARDAPQPVKRVFGRAQRTAKSAAAVRKGLDMRCLQCFGTAREFKSTEKVFQRAAQEAEDAADDAPKPLKRLFGGAQRRAGSATSVRSPTSAVSDPQISQSHNSLSGSTRFHCLSGHQCASQHGVRSCSFKHVLDAGQALRNNCMDTHDAAVRRQELKNAAEDAKSKAPSPLASLLGSKRRPEAEKVRN